MAVFDDFSEVFELASKEFYAPLLADRKRPRKSKAANQVSTEHRVPKYLQYLAQLRRNAGIRQQTMALEMRSSQSSISRFEVGRGNPTLEFILRYCKIVNVEIGIAFKELPRK